ncbi:hypothetical protein L2E82_18449 [Cichorium intybus]|uniref:Uncharacterized protein n=1 Tax=Cichorium intybus TaxID=13427 RepID=A0ACB9FB55_CICIN|nr:hypothetical protein L2E82_18449 [Cichorium intybus]
MELSMWVWGAFAKKKGGDFGSGGLTSEPRKVVRSFYLPAKKRKRQISRATAFIGNTYAHTSRLPLSSLDRHPILQSHPSIPTLASIKRILRDGMIFISQTHIYLVFKLLKISDMLSVVPRLIQCYRDGSVADLQFDAIFLYFFGSTVFLSQNTEGCC